MGYLCSGLLIPMGLILVGMGRLRLFGRTLVGNPVRLMGLLLILAFPVYLAIIAFWVFFLPRDWLEENFARIEFVVPLISIISVIILWVITPKTKLASVGYLPNVLSIDEAAEFLQATPGDVVKLIQLGQLSAAKSWGNQYTIRRDAIIKFLNKNGL